MSLQGIVYLTISVYSCPFFVLYDFESIKKEELPCLKRFLDSCSVSVKR